MKHYTFEGLRCLFMFAIFCGHLGAYQIPVFQAIGNALGGDTGVTFFFLLSGFVAELSLNKKPLQKQGYLRWMGKKIWRFYPLHIATMLLAIPFLLLKHGDMPVKIAGILLSDILLFKSLIPCRDYHFALNGVSWFLSTWLILTAISPLLHRICQKSNPIIFASSILLRIAIFILAHVYNCPVWFTYISPVFRVFDYLIGMSFCSVILKNMDYLEQERGANIARWSLLEAVVLILPFAMPFLITIETGLTNFVMALLIFCVFACKQGGVSRLLGRAVFAKLGAGVYVFFLLHQLIIEYVYIIQRKAAHIYVNDIIASLITFIIAFTLSVYVTKRLRHAK